MSTSSSGGRVLSLLALLAVPLGFGHAVFGIAFLAVFDPLHVVVGLLYLFPGALLVPVAVGIRRRRPRARRVGMWAFGLLAVGHAGALLITSESRIYIALGVVAILAAMTLLTLPDAFDRPK